MSFSFLNSQIWCRTRYKLFRKKTRILEKLNWFSLTSLITMVLFMWKWMGLFLRRNNHLRCWGWLSLLNWIRALTLSLLLKLPPRNWINLFYEVSFSRGCSLSLWIYHMPMYGILLSCLGWCSSLLLGIVQGISQKIKTCNVFSRSGN